MRKSEKVMTGLFCVPMLISLLGLGILALAFMSGCSTVSGVGKLMGGIGADIEDMAEGSRQRMKERN